MCNNQCLYGCNHCCFYRLSINSWKETVFSTYYMIVMKVFHSYIHSNNSLLQIIFCKNLLGHYCNDALVLQNSNQANWATQILTTLLIWWMRKLPMTFCGSKPCRDDLSHPFYRRWNNVPLKIIYCINHYSFVWEFCILLLFTYLFMLIVL